ncbi:MAG: DUF2330 domain-containing protein [Planctomycetota bacterium]
MSEVVGVAEQRAPAQSAQQAAIVWENGHETLHLQSNYSGPARGFSWVIPVPARPKVERSSWDIFRAAEELTRPRVALTRVKGGGLGCGCGVQMWAEPDRRVETGVTMLESLEIRELHVDILAAKEGGGFIRWLRKNGYAVPEEARRVLQEYIDKGFFFVAVKMRPESLAALAKSGRGDVTTGLTPLAITFEAERPFFPLKISSISSAPENELLLLTIAPTRLTPVQYAEVEFLVEDIKRELGPALSGRDEVAELDLGQATRTAQARSHEAALVVEAAVPVSWVWLRDGQDPRLEVTYLPDAKLWVTRLHAFLKPAEMRDISFATAADREALYNTFWIDESDLPIAWAPAGFVLAGIGLVLISRRGRDGPRLRKLAMALFAAACCIA